ncbi:MFS transporter [Limobrevibacterium gyesilva]|uniref:Putative tartrate transporter n=1 Tax=Limobrevibacterium gyesilva TaxID=2991712 RepID=A0AA42CH96_9PROT|nr:MFS transporter [Limobrevibacterium gyesilva]MCW3477016.1 MFS transporter [Limobrevibacterium gyesilva]
MQELEDRVIRKVSVRLIPFLILCYFVAYLDRVNVSFAALTMNKDLGLSASAYGAGAGIFFLAYFLFEVPSNLMLDRFGARKWIARIMFSWGLLSGLMAAIPAISRSTGLSNEHSFYAVRVLLGMAEAGFFPGIIFYLTLWFPAIYRARIVGYFMAAIPLSSVIGAPVSSALLYLDGAAGLAGWQWLFVIEAVPALILSVVVFFYLTDRPNLASWLSLEERAWLSGRLEAEQRQREAVHSISVVQALLNPKVLALALVYFGAVACNYGVGFWLPQIVKAFGLSNFATGWVTAIPYVIGTVAMVWYGRHSDRKHERKLHAASALALAAIGIAGSTLFTDPTLKMIAFTIGAVGVFGVLPVFWTLPTAFLSGTAAAAGIAVINSIGNLSGYLGPQAMGWIKDATGSFDGGLLLIGGFAVLGMITVLLLHHDHALEMAPEAKKPATA